MECLNTSQNQKTTLKIFKTSQNLKKILILKSQKMMTLETLKVSQMVNLIQIQILMMIQNLVVFMLLEGKTLKM